MINTVLLWGRAWWVDDAEGPLPFDDLSQAADVLAHHYRDGKTRLRIVYQPDHLETISIRCPNAGRTTLAMVLAADFPALEDPRCAWSYEPILPIGQEFSTVLHFEREPGALFALTNGLEKLGFAIESVWPLGTFIHALPKEWNTSGATNILALQPQYACAYHHPADGPRAIHVWRGENALAEVAEWLHTLLAKNPAEPLLIVAEDEETEALDAIVPFLESERINDSIHFLQICEALDADAVLPRHHPAQLIPPAPLLSPRRAIIAASAAMLAVTALWSAVQVHDSLTRQAENAQREQKERTLRGEVVQLRANAHEIATLNADLVAMAPRAVGVMLQRLARTLPRGIALASLNVSASGFTLTGYVAPMAPPGIVAAWVEKFASAGGSLRFQPASPLTPDGRFTLTAEFPG